MSGTGGLCPISLPAPPLEQSQTIRDHPSPGTAHGHSQGLSPHPRLGHFLLLQLEICLSPGIPEWGSVGFCSLCRVWCLCQSMPTPCAASPVLCARGWQHPAGLGAFPGVLVALSSTAPGKSWGVLAQECLYSSWVAGSPSPGDSIALSPGAFSKVSAGTGVVVCGEIEN